MNPFLEGSILGITLAVLLGPAMFALLQTSIHHGFRSAMQLAIGIFLSDLTLVFLCFIGALQIISSDNNRLIFGIISGSILIIYGIATFLKHIEPKGNGENGNGLNQKPAWFTFILKGYFLNIANPFVWVFWISVTVGVTSNYGDHTRSAMFFFGGALFTIFSTDLIKAYIAKKIKNLLNSTNIKRMNQLVGLLLFSFGVVLIVRALIANYQSF